MKHTTLAVAVIGLGLVAGWITMVGRSLDCFDPSVFHE